MPLIAAWWMACADDPPTPCAGLEVMAGVDGINGLGEEGQPATDTWLSLPQDVEPLPGGGFLIGDANNHRILEVDADGHVTRVVGAGFPGIGDGGPATQEPIQQPTMAAADPTDPGIVWFAATANNRVGRVVDGEVTFPLGADGPGYSGDDGPGTEAELSRPSSLAFDERGRVFVSDRMNQVIRRLDADGTVHHVAGTPGVAGYDGDGGPATAAVLNAMDAYSMDPSNRLAIRGDWLVFADTGNNVIREIDLATGVIDTLAGDGVPGFADGPTGDARFLFPRDVAIGPDGAVYVADAGNLAIRRILDGEVTTLAEGPADGIGFPAGVAVDGDGAWWVVDRDRSVVLRSCPPGR